MKQKDTDLKPIHPGEILREELLIPLKISVEKLASSTKIKDQVIKEIVAENYDITPDISYRLGLFFDLREDYWLNNNLLKTIKDQSITPVTSKEKDLPHAEMKIIDKLFTKDASSPSSYYIGISKLASNPLSPLNPPPPL